MTQKRNYRSPQIELLSMAVLEAVAADVNKIDSTLWEDPNEGEQGGKDIF